MMRWSRCRGTAVPQQQLRAQGLPQGPPADMMRGVWTAAMRVVLLL